MLQDLDGNGGELAGYMSELSQKAYYDDWRDDLEFELWDAVVNGPCEYGRLRVTTEHIARLRQLCDAAGGWIVFDDVEGETLVTMAEWQLRYDNWKTRSR